MNGPAAGPTDAPPLHATLIAARRRGSWCGVLIRGGSGTGKSDLALRAMAAGWRLVADDRVRAWISGGRLYGAPPATLASLIEIRGLGVCAAAALPFVRLELAVEAATLPREVDRLPDPSRLHLLGLELPRLCLALCEPSALPKLDLALDAALRRQL